MVDHYLVSKLPEKSKITPLRLLDSEEIISLMGLSALDLLPKVDVNLLVCPYMRT